MSGPGERVGGEGCEGLVGGARGLTACKAVTVAHGAGEGRGGVGYISTAAATAENDIFVGGYFNIVTFGHLEYERGL